MDLVKEIYAKLKTINTSDSKINLMCDDGNNTINIKCDKELKDKFEVDIIYYFKVSYDPNSSRNSANLVEFKKLAECDIDYKLQDKMFRKFCLSSKMSIEELEKIVYEYIEKIDNKIVKQITLNLVNKYKREFFIYPAASKMHHAYVGGIAEHACGMLKLADGFVTLYDFVDKDYLYAGVILHDLGKIKEYTGVQNTNYTLDGHLIGHLVIGSQMVLDEANALGVKDSMESKLMQHLILAHHGQLNYGSPKRPMTAEALLLWQIDSLDSKLVVLEEELEKINVGDLTDSLQVLDRGRFLKHK